MKNRTIVLALAAALFLAGCVVTSVHPFYTTKDVVFEPALLGQWTNTTQPEEHWTFHKEGQDSYTLSYVSDGKTNVIRAYLFKLSGQMFLDFATLERDCDIVPPPIPSHLVLRVTRLTPTVGMAPLNHDWLMTLLEKQPKTLRHIMVSEKPDDQRVVLTAETSELQQFLREHLKTEEAWKDAFEIKREGVPSDK